MGPDGDFEIVKAAQHELLDYMVGLGISTRELHELIDVVESDNFVIDQSLSHRGVVTPSVQRFYANNYVGRVGETAAMTGTECYNQFIEKIARWTSKYAREVFPPLKISCSESILLWDTAAIYDICKEQRKVDGVMRYATILHLSIEARNLPLLKWCLKRRYHFGSTDYNLLCETATVEAIQHVNTYKENIVGYERMELFYTHPASTTVLSSTFYTKEKLEHVFDSISPGDFSPSEAKTFVIRICRGLYHITETDAIHILAMLSSKRWFPPRYPLSWKDVMCACTSMSTTKVARACRKFVEDMAIESAKQ